MNEMAEEEEEEEGNRSWLNTVGGLASLECCLDRSDDRHGSMRGVTGGGGWGVEN
jgi:hypothetical protein